MTGLTSARRVGPRGRPAPPGPADLVTGLRGLLVLLLLALVLPSLMAGGTGRGWAVAGLGILVWALDAVDGWVARRTGTASARGALLDSGVDGTLVLVLSLAHLPQTPWALVGGLLWPAFLLGQALRPAWRATLPPDRWRRLAGGTLTGTLAVSAAPLWPVPAVQVAVALAVLWVVRSFAVDVRWLERRAAVARGGAAV